MLISGSPADGVIPEILLVLRSCHGNLGSAELLARVQLPERQLLDRLRHPVERRRLQRLLVEALQLSLLKRRSRSRDAETRSQATE